MMLTGHKTRSILDRYDIVSEGDLRDAVNKRRVLKDELLANLPKHLAARLEAHFVKWWS